MPPPLPPGLTVTSDSALPSFDLFVLPGLSAYDDVIRLQHRYREERRNGTRADCLILLEHRPVITLGRNADPTGLLATPEELAREGIEVRRVERGGQATYHGPGQVVGYPIVALRDRGMGVKRFVAALEEVMLRVCRRWGLEAQTTEGRPGVFTNKGKIGAVGVAVAGGVTYHGLALNVRPRLENFRWIVPCGLTDTEVTSMEAMLGGACPPTEVVRRALADAFAGTFRVQWNQEAPAAK